MALTPMRWIVGAIAGCALIMLALTLKPVESAPRVVYDDDVFGGWWYQTPARVLEGKLGRENERLRMLELRDSLVTVLNAAPARPMSILIDAAVPVPLREQIDSLLSRQWRGLAISGGQPTAIAIVVDSSTKVHGLPRGRRFIGGTPVEVFLPTTDTGGRCIALLHLAWRPAPTTSGRGGQLAANITSPETIKALLSPCAFYAAFGTPGPAVSRWLFDTRWNPARFAGWNESPRRWESYRGSRQLYLEAIDALAFRADSGWEMRQYIAPAGIGCIAGRTGACSTALLAPRTPLADSGWRANVVISSGSSPISFYFPQRPSPLGPSDAWVLSEMVRTLGRERFARFWTSSQPVPVAFKEASGQDIGEWTAAWAQRVYGAATVGPTIPMRGLGTGIVIFALGLATAALIGSKRRVV